MSRRVDWWGADLLNAGAGSDVWASGTAEVSRATLRTEVRRAADLLAAQGVRAGSTVLVRGASSFTQLWSVFALWSLGAQVMFADTWVRGPVADLALAGRRPRFRLLLGWEPQLNERFDDECSVLLHRDPAGTRATTPHCLVQTTSGSTGPLRVVGRTAESLLRETYRTTGVPGMPGPGERVLLLGPVPRSFTLVSGVLQALAVGATVVFRRRPTLDGLAEALRGTHVVLAAPRHIAEMAALPRGAGCSLRAVVSGGDVLPDPVADRFTDRFGMRPGQAYGTTETGLIAADPLGERPGTVGRPIPGVRTAVEDGELLVRLPDSPYPDRDPRRPGGWFESGDLAAVDGPDGAVRLFGRTPRPDGATPGRRHRAVRTVRPAAGTPARDTGRPRDTRPVLRTVRRPVSHDDGCGPGLPADRTGIQ